MNGAQRVFEYKKSIQARKNIGLIADPVEEPDSPEQASPSEW